MPAVVGGSIVTRRQRDLKRQLLELAGPNATVHLEHSGGNHLRATLKRGDRCLVFFFSLTPSDQRGRYEETAFVRRKLRELTGRTA
jgi:hypothetical protein